MSTNIYKDEAWFSHASNAKDDFKCLLLIEQLGLEGYGIYWVLVETLREQKDYRYPYSMLSALARKYNTTEAKMQVVVKDYNLFDFDGEAFFFSKSLLRRMQALDDAREKKRLAGKKSGEARRKKAIEQCSSSVQTGSEHKRTSKAKQSIAQHIILEDEDEEDELQKALDIISCNSIKSEELLDDFVTFVTMGDNSKIKNVFIYQNNIKKNLMNRDAKTLDNFKVFLQNKEVVHFIKKSKNEC